MRLYPLATLLAASVASASPEEQNVRARAAKPFCKTVKSVVTSAHQQSAATAFCSSFLSIPQSTQTSTTVTIVTSTSNAGAQSTFTQTSTSTVTVTPTCGSSGGGSKMVRRDKKKPAQKKPPCFGKYTASAVLSSACSCLHIPPKTTTTTVTSTSTSTTTVGGGTSTTTTTTVTTSLAAVPTPDTFRIYGSAGSPAAGLHLLIDASTSGQGAGTFVIQPGDLFQLQGGQLVTEGGGNIAYQHDPSVSNSDIVYFAANPNIINEGGHKLSCAINPVLVGTGYGCVLVCSQGTHAVDTLTTNTNGQPVWQIESPPASGTAFTPMVEDSQ